MTLDGTRARASPTTATAAAVHVSWQGSGTARVAAGARLLDRRFQLADASLVVDRTDDREPQGLELHWRRCRAEESAHVSRGAAGATSLPLLARAHAR